MYINIFGDNRSAYENVYQNVCTLIIMYVGKQGDRDLHITMHMNIHCYTHLFFQSFIKNYCTAYICMAIGKVGYSYVYSYAWQYIACKIKNFL